MLTYILDRSKEGKSLYEGLYDGIKADILSGKIKSDEKLPSKRSLADHLNVSVITVENAYAQLIAEGYVYTKQRSGYYANKIDAVSLKTSNEKLPDEKELPEYELDLRSGNTIGKFPFTVWAKTMRSVIIEKEKDIMQPVAFNGIKELRTAIAEYLYRCRGMSVSPENIVIGAGTEYLYNLLVQLLGRDKEYAVEDPGYDKTEKIYSLNNVKCHRIPLDKEGISVKKLRRSGANIVHISPAHHYPTGIVMPIRRRNELLVWSLETDDRYILEDEYDSEFRFTGRPLPTLFGVDNGGRVIYINTFSKTIAPSLRISYMVLPGKLMERYKSEMGFYSCTVPSPEQYTLARFISDGSFEKHINRMRTFYRKKRNEVINIIENSDVFPKIEILEENAGLHFLLKINTEVSDKEAAENAERVGIKLSFLSDFSRCAGDDLAHQIVVNYSGLEIQKLISALDKFKEIFKL